MDVISWQHSHIREDTLLNMLLLSALHAHCDSGPAWADLTPGSISDRNSSHLEQVVFSYYKDYRCQSLKQQQRRRERLVIKRVGQVLTFRYALLQQVHQNRPCLCLHSPRHELRASQLADTYQALHGCLNQGWPVVLHPAKCTYWHIKKTEGI